MRYNILFTLLLLSTLLQGQIRFNNTEVILLHNRPFFSEKLSSSADLIGYKQYICSPDTTQTLGYIHSFTLWFTGKRNNVWQTAYERTGMVDNDFYQPGPIDKASITNANTLYNRTYYFENTLKNHILFNGRPGYLAPEVVTNYPGSVQANYQVKLPFADANKNGLYEPSLGEHPLVLGKNNLVGIKSTPQKPDQLNNIEMTYHFFNVPSANENIKNTLFVRFEITNRNDTPIDSFIIGAVNSLYYVRTFDFNVKSKVDRNAVYWMLDPSRTKRNGRLNAAQGFILLNNDLDRSVATSFNGPNNGILNLTSNIASFFLRGKARNGGPLSEQNNERYAFSEYPTDSSVYATSSVYGIMAMIPPFTLAPNASKVIDAAFVFALAADSSALGSAYKLFDAMDEVKDYYDNSPLSVNDQEVTVLASNTLLVYPNPSQNSLNLKSQQSITSVVVYDISGKQVLSANGEVSNIAVGSLEKGYYIINATTKDGSLLKSTFIKE